MSGAPLGWWLLLLAGVVMHTLGAVQPRSRARGHALKAGDALAPKQARALLLIDPNEIANPCQLQA